MIDLARWLARREPEYVLRANPCSSRNTEMCSPSGTLHGPVKTLVTRASGLVNSIRELGPYAAIALTVPGGTLVALVLLSLRHRSALTTPLFRGLTLVALMGVLIVLPAST